MWKVKTHSAGKVWETQTFQSSEFRTSVARSRNPYNSQNMGKVNCHTMGKLCVNYVEVLHSAYGQSSGFHFLTSFLKTLIVVRFFISMGIKV